MHMSQDIPDRKKLSETTKIMAEELRGQLEEAPTDQRWNDLSIEEDNDQISLNSWVLSNF